ncbi:hypothetical protein THRCLA_10345 [Thraustotheca clavata]|uniref:Uncharacterized protein n=1 Tax=Thraustotheca clavata TaxID=74557 RepID=A0A1V9YRK3_9STRA|nr:hypothetical protein THRCLA_10345 [Thraustotheca clavata]
MQGESTDPYGLEQVKAERTTATKHLNTKHHHTIFTDCNLDEIEVGHRWLYNQYKEDTVFKTTLQNQGSYTNYNDAWDTIQPQSKVKKLRMFLGGLASAFANNIPVESDFLILKWEMDEFHSFCENPQLKQA